MGDAFVTVVKVLASLSALYMCLSPTSAMYKVHKLQSTGTASIVPLVALWGCNHMWLLYGYVTNDVFPLMVTYIVGDVTSMAFICVYYRYTSAKKLAQRACAAVLLINAIATVYAVLGKTGRLHERQADVKLVVGIFAMASSVFLYASPFATIKHVVATRSSESIPFVMVVVGLVNNALWILYGCLIHDAMLVIPTSVNVCIGGVQFVLYFVYHPTRQKPGAAVVAGAVASNVGGGAIEIVTDAPRLEQPQVAKASDSTSIQVEDDHHYVSVSTPNGRKASSGFAN